MDWTDDGIILSSRRYGETSAIVSILTCEHGRHSGLVRGGDSRRLRPILQTGNIVRCIWRGRLHESLGSFTLELKHATAGILLNDAVLLAGMSSACALINVLVPERENYSRVFSSLVTLLIEIESDISWLKEYVHWEVQLLRELGFGLSLNRCAVTGETDDLIWVSPRTGRAVSRRPGLPYSKQLLSLPKFLIRQSEASSKDLLLGLYLTGYFLNKAAVSSGCILPAARIRLIDTFSRMNTTYCADGNI